MGRILLWLPLALFAALALFFASGLLRPDERVITSKLVGKPLPAFELPQAASDRPPLSSAEFAKGKPRMLNIFASWCVPCAAESSQLDSIPRKVSMEGISGHCVRGFPQVTPWPWPRNPAPFPY